MGKTNRRKDEDKGESEIMLQTLEKEVSATKGIMRENIEKMHERHGKLDDLESRAEILAGQTTVEFKKLATQTKNQVEKKSRRRIFILAGIAIFVALIIILILALYFTGNFS